MCIADLATILTNSNYTVPSSNGDHEHPIEHKLSECRKKVPVNKIIRKT